MSAWGGVFRQIKRNPDGYRWFGPWWYSVKWLLRQDGFAMGHNDDPDVRELMDAHAGNDPKSIVRMAMVHDQAHAANFESGQTAMLDGTPYFLNDTEDVLRATGAGLG